MMSDAKKIFGDVLVLGLGKTGVSVAKYFISHNNYRSITVYGGASSKASDVTCELEKLGCRVVVGIDNVEGSYDLCISSPGISEFSEFFKSASKHSKEIISEPELAWRVNPDNWIAVTGTNGKTTLVSMIYHALKIAEKDVILAGNIGEPLISKVSSASDLCYKVAELSSFQLACTRNFKPSIAILTNITPDHKEWHKTFNNYVEAKKKIFKNLDGRDLAILNIDDEICAGIAQELKNKCDVVCVSTKDVTDSFKVSSFEMKTSDLKLSGEHNIAKAKICAAVCLRLGISNDTIREALSTFEPLEHRCEEVGVIDGVRYIDDSKATNVDATLAALKSYEAKKVIVLLGGHDKCEPLDDLACAVKDSCKYAICYGEAKPRFVSELKFGGVECIKEAEHLHDAFDLTHSLASDGDIVLLSPACSSFDEFSGFVERGNYFKAMVKNLGGGSNA